MQKFSSLRALDRLDRLVAHLHLGIRFFFNLEVSIGSFGTEAGGQGGFTDAAPGIVLLVVRRRVLEIGGKRTSHVHWSLNP